MNGTHVARVIEDMMGKTFIHLRDVNGNIYKNITFQEAMTCILGVSLENA